MTDRFTYLDPKAPSIPCGFLSSSSLDKVRQHFSHDTKCEIVVYSLIFQAYNVIYNPISYDNYLQQFPNICFFLFVDISTVLNGHSLEYVGEGVSNTQRSKFNLNSEIVGGQAWQIILLDDLPYTSAAHSMKAIKMSGSQLFPNAKTFVWFDPKYVLKRKVPRFLRDIQGMINDDKSSKGNASGYKSDREHNTTCTKEASVAISEHFFHNVEAGFVGARDRIIHQNLTYKANPFATSEIAEIARQKAVYKQEGLFSRTRGNVGLVVDSAVMVYHNTEESRRYFCAWGNEISMFSRRDQLSEYAVRE